MINRRELLVGAGALAFSPRSSPLISADDLAFLQELAAATLKSATKEASRATLGFACTTPGGDYPSMWVRDYSMASGSVSVASLHDHLRLIAGAQNSSERKLGDRARIPANAIPDHITYEGGAVFYPGTYSPGDDQGGEPYGKLPPMDDHYEFIHIAYQLWKRTKSRAFLEEKIGGVSLIQRLVGAFDCPTVDVASGICMTKKGERAVGFGFCDGVYLTGKLLFPTLLRHRALGELLEMSGGGRGLATRLGEWKSERTNIEAHVVPTFFEKGWLKAATEVGQQPDVWGTAFALYQNVVRGKTRRLLLHTLAEAVRAGTITYQGGVRHVPTDHDFSATSAWEQTAGEGLNRYQNGAYWHVPTGWLARVLNENEPAHARQLVKDMVQHFRDEDFRKPGGGAPWECLHSEGRYRQNPVYLASVTLPLKCLSGSVRN